jgi:hypothetical protein
MMTYTSAPEYAKENIFINAVDTSWVDDMYPTGHVNNINKKPFVPPLDATDGASRILDLVFLGVQQEKNKGSSLSSIPPFGKFFKDYHVSDW